MLKAKALLEYAYNQARASVPAPAPPAPPPPSSASSARPTPAPRIGDPAAAASALAEEAANLVCDFLRLCFEESTQTLGMGQLLTTDVLRLIEDLMALLSLEPGAAGPLPRMQTRRLPARFSRSLSFSDTYLRAALLHVGLVQVARLLTQVMQEDAEAQPVAALLNTVAIALFPHLVPPPPESFVPTLTLAELADRLSGCVILRSCTRKVTDEQIEDLLRHYSHFAHHGVLLAQLGDVELFARELPSGGERPLPDRFTRDDPGRRYTISTAFQTAHVGLIVEIALMRHSPLRPPLKVPEHSNAADAQRDARLIAFLASFGTDPENVLATSAQFVADWQVTWGEIYTAETLFNNRGTLGAARRMDAVAVFSEMRSPDGPPPLNPRLLSSAYRDEQAERRRKERAAAPAKEKEGASAAAGTEAAAEAEAEIEEEDDVEVLQWTAAFALAQQLSAVNAAVRDEIFDPRCRHLDLRAVVLWLLWLRDEVGGRRPRAEDIFGLYCSGPVWGSCGKWHPSPTAAFLHFMDRKLPEGEMTIAGKTSAQTYDVIGAFPAELFPRQREAAEASRVREREETAAFAAAGLPAGDGPGAAEEAVIRRDLAFLGLSDAQWEETFGRGGAATAADGPGDSRAHIAAQEESRRRKAARRRRQRRDMRRAAAAAPGGQEAPEVPEAPGIPEVD